MIGAYLEWAFAGTDPPGVDNTEPLLSDFSTHHGLFYMLISGLSIS